MLINLPLPPTTNSTYQIGRGRMFKSERSSDWEREAFYKIKEDANHARYSLPVKIEIKFNIVRERDVDGAIKLVLDILQKACVIENDRLVTDLKVTKNKVFKNPSVMVNILPF